jgi:hypothetical protein
MVWTKQIAILFVNRNVVLHKYFDVPYIEQDEIGNSYYCPMVNEKFIKRIEKIIDNSEKNIIMSIINKY